MTITDDIKSAEKRMGVFVTAHHIVLYVALALALLTGVYLVESKIAAVAEEKAQASQTALAIEKDHSSQLIAQYATAQAERNKENQAFMATIVQLQTQAKVQIIHDKTLPPPELGNRIEDITGFKRGTITLDITQNLIVPLPIGREIVSLLDQGAADAQIVTKQNGVIKNQTETITQQAGIIAEDKVILAKQIKADGDELKLVKANARKGKMKWFGIGVAVGFVGRQFVHFGLS